MVNDFEVIVEGLAKMVAPFSNRVRVVEFDVDATPSRRVDVALFDTFAASDDPESSVAELARTGNVGKIVAYSWDLNATAIDRAIASGASGYLSKALPADALVEALERIHGGEVLVAAPEPGGDASAGSARSWPGAESGLTERESEVIALIARGLSNEDITKRLYLSINTIKSYIRSAYRKIGVSSRVEAVLWAIEHGFVVSAARFRPQRQS